MTSKNKYIKTLDKFLDIMKSKSKPSFYENEKDQIAEDLITACRKADLYDELQSILEEYNVTPEILREVLLTGQMFRNQPTLLECIKEWNEKGFDVDVYALEIVIHNRCSVANEEHSIEFTIDLKDKTLFMEGKYNSFPYDVIHLLSKTLKALEVENGK